MARRRRRRWAMERSHGISSRWELIIRRDIWSSNRCITERASEEENPIYERKLRAACNEVIVRIEMIAQTDQKFPNIWPVKDPFKQMTLIVTGQDGMCGLYFKDRMACDRYLADKKQKERHVDEQRKCVVLSASITVIDDVVSSWHSSDGFVFISNIAQPLSTGRNEFVGRRWFGALRWFRGAFGSSTRVRRFVSVFVVGVSSIVIIDLIVVFRDQTKLDC